ncbi:hypothetical protein [Paraconexibacter algicola]|uniref:Uncharacterized protein n=1 Tax=Paraconexibacter algicola TaxID=2133960 RepID=A0A2T4UIS2_9ACTN|nr:hypothetical protein [Paraconexibacter algicola]PTL59141.1 hypothetical protein C7Y72_05495 [Paraconexibacter algicola]
MKRSILSLVVAAMALASLWSASAPAAAGKCPSGDAPVIISTDAVKVFRSGENYLGCLRRSRTRHRVGQRYSDLGGSSRARLFQIAGRFVAFAEDKTGRGDDTNTQVSVVDLRTGRARGHYTAGASPFPLAPARDLVINEQGQQAWTIDGAVRAATRYGSRLIASSPELDALSLRRRGSSEFCWTTAGTERCEAFPTQQPWPARPHPNYEPAR